MSDGFVIHQQTIQASARWLNRFLLRNEQNVEECDATGDAMKYKSR
ncbi:MAG: hypothetical protein KGL19_05825 [Bacteroidota bacterium]|nr:hypothetical protein [Bacteroidota bacterium]